MCGSTCTDAMHAAYFQLLIHDILRIWLARVHFSLGSSWVCICRQGIHCCCFVFMWCFGAMPLIFDINVAISPKLD